MQYLLKTEPSEYSFADLVVTNPRFGRGIKPASLEKPPRDGAGDRLIIYHTGDQKSAVGTAVVTTVDDKNPGIRHHIKAGQKLSPVTLSTIKSQHCSKLSPGAPGRLSVVPLDDKQYKFC